ncbi:tRNA(i6A37) synthase [Campylobacter blaseri]|uniref:tRNA dimethylallyltransferase n=1 Tax=Campylobacter blaseri TaxID=2042961 RepID=A0A2P8R0Z5_9BACT|nr:tRNA (adenosine(37)-N6)-dimethylallyltransferase MiaA [Campylobacter blaseri]PSM52173.1 tRNA (adenosine(37)-N6)-dimethylallyltransferase MiaA [Campylobacter blaseri]PSM53939.1 tRNA (adenosine(37)-N6)-dimethylallyltransferase MiaA [Campylobacter blaseri]QKF85375.1 tRNA(i6A37) synthase [Campylobacter blaseri]
MFVEFAIIGTTASGKSNLALEIAQKYNGIILSLDSLSVYKEIDIVSAKPSKNELSLVRHFGINLIYPNKHFSVGNFIKEYRQAKEHAKKLNVPLIITGGSSFYLKTMLSGLSPKIDNVKTDLKNDEIYEIIKDIDPQFALKYSQNDSYRLLKWYSIYKTTNQIPTKFLKENTSKPTINHLKIFEIKTDKEILREKIKARTKKMFEAGLLDEAKYLFSKYDNSLKALNCIGLKECKDYFDNKISKNELVDLITIHTVQLAKRQRTFNKSKFKDKISLDIESLKVAIEDFLTFNNH